MRKISIKIISILLIILTLFTSVQPVSKALTTGDSVTIRAGENMRISFAIFKARPEYGALL